MRCDEFTVLDAMGLSCRIRMKYFHLTFLLLQLLCLHLRGISSLRASQLRIIPPVVERGADATLSCLYDLQGAPLYSVKWYRGRHEFYRYSPTEQPDTKIFPFVGINVDLTRSNETQVVLVKVGFRLSGNFTCEVTADAPSFSTSVVSNHMEVVALPKWPPRLTTERGHYAPGDVLRGNCTASPAKPAPLLLLYLNDEQVSGEYDSELSSDGLQVSRLAVRVRLLPAHFDRGPPVLRCEALLAPVYRDSNELVLHHARGDPRLQRVTSSTSGPQRALSRLSCASWLLCLFTINRLHI